jgi:hypothetical protein
MFAIEPEFRALGPGFRASAYAVAAGSRRDPHVSSDP